MVSVAPIASVPNGAAAVITASGNDTPFTVTVPGVRVAFPSTSVTFVFVSGCVPLLTTVTEYAIDCPGLTVEELGTDVFATTSVGCPIVMFETAGAAFVAPCVSPIEPALIVFVYVPGTVPVTLTVIVHVPLIAIAPPARVTVEPPAVAVAVPPQVVAAFGVAATVTFAGSVSVTPTAVSGTVVVAVFSNVIVRTEVPPGAITIGENAFVIPTPETLPTLSSAVAGAALVAPWFVVIAPAGIVFVQMPGAELVTVTVIVQLAFADTEPLFSVTVEPPA